MCYNSNTKLMEMERLKLIYLDHAATTPICDAAKKTMIEHIDYFGNPSSAHDFGRQSRVLIENARERIAKCINADPSEIYFTSGGSEANTLALNHRRHSMSSKFEHHSVVSDWPKISITKDGFIKSHKLNNMLSEWWEIPFDVMSCMYVNNEIGTIQPVKELSTIAHRYGILLHTDAVQAMPYIPIDVKDLGCDMLSASGHKFGAAKGVGFLYANKRSKLHPIINGGKQEDAIRPGTENILGILSMATALEESIEYMDERNAYIKNLRDKLLDKLLQIPGSHLNGSIENRIPGNINIRFSGVSGAKLVTLCSLYGIYISSGSACNEGISTPSHVLKAIDLTDEEALSSVRITIGHTNTEEEINQAANIITALVKRVRDEV
jgi:cysteine desulfurase